MSRFVRPEPICGVDYEVCKGCGGDFPPDDFVDAKYVHHNYCEDCREKCDFCGDWIGICGGEHEEAK